MLTQDTGQLGILANMIERQDRGMGGINFHIAQQLRGRKKTLHGYAYAPVIQKAGGNTLARFPDRDYMVTKKGEYVRIHPIDKDRVIVGRQNIKKYLAARKAAAIEAKGEENA